MADESKLIRVSARTHWRLRAIATAHDATLGDVVTWMTDERFANDAPEELRVWEEAARSYGLGPSKVEKEEA